MYWRPLCRCWYCCFGEEGAVELVAVDEGDVALDEVDDEGFGPGKWAGWNLGNWPS